MIDPNEKESSQINPSDVCTRAFELMAAKQWNDAERLLSSNMSKTKDDIAIALYHSALGVLYKMKREFKVAWRHYSRAEKLMPNDPSLKIISARLLIEEFAEYDQAIRKANKVLKLAKGNPVFEHQAYTTMGLAWTGKGNRRKATNMLLNSVTEDFEGFISAQNIDLNLVEALLKKGWAIEEARIFLKKALVFAKAKGEEKYITLFSKIGSAFEAEYKIVPEK